MDVLWFWGAAAIVLATTLLPYLYGWALAQGRIFMWLGYNLDDSCVYLSWMRQAQDGSLIGFNLFTTASQHGMLLNPLFLALGLAARITHLPLLMIYHGSRLLFGLLLLRLVWLLARQVLSDPLAQRAALLFVGVSSGLGWLPIWWNDNPISTPIDKWQPEAITYLSLYLSPLFCFSMALQVAILLLLLRGERQENWRDSAWAGGAGLILALVHTYDIVSLALVWLTYLLVSALVRYRTEKLWKRGAWVRAAVAGTIALPGVLYIASQLRSEAVFQKRADVATLAPSMGYVLLGYGLILLLALCEIYFTMRSHRSTKPDELNDEPKPTLRWSDRESLLFVICWSVANLAAAYLPTTFQRKLLQGEHIPIALLAGAGMVGLLTHPGSRIPTRYHLPLVAVTALLLSITNIRFMIRDMSNFQADLSQTRQQRPYLRTGEWLALKWVEAHVPTRVPVQPLPYVHLMHSPDGRTKLAATDMTLACFTPGMTHHKVYCGHWGETPDYGAKLQELAHFSLPDTTDEERLALLHKMRVRYLLFSQKDPQDDDADRLAPMFRGQAPAPPYLHLVYSNADADVYQADL